MEDPSLGQLENAFRAQGVEPPPEYMWLVKHRTLGFKAFTQLEPGSKSLSRTA